ncbi:MAG: hypothetical protein GY858_07405 [Candidatus Omnitrophica bacterium]|nr:hypothetical protein [Candidatus Omnitrophota bacterium]
MYSKTMPEHNHIKNIITEAIGHALSKNNTSCDSKFESALVDCIFNRIADKYCNETTYARTQSIDLQLKADVIRELPTAMIEVKNTSP